jgi:zinc transporter ZupT
LLDGVAIGEAFPAGTSISWIVSLAVIVHKFADGVSTVDSPAILRARRANSIDFQ